MHLNLSVLNYSQSAGAKKNVSLFVFVFMSECLRTQLVQLLSNCGQWMHNN